MLCEKCNEREAVVTLTLVTNGVTRTHHYCQECANQFRLDEANENSELSKTIFRILSEAINSQKPDNTNAERPAEQADPFCPVCGKSFREFREDGLFGCPNCIGAFKDSVNGMILSLQGSDSHTGSRPEKIRKRKKTAKDIREEQEREKEKVFTDLKNQLDSAVLLEDYRKAAEIRDRIRALSEGQEEKSDE